jgi:hypothetical protein
MIAPLNPRNTESRQAPVQRPLVQSHSARPIQTTSQTIKEPFASTPSASHSQSPSSEHKFAWFIGISGAVLLLWILVHVSQTSAPHATSSRFQSSLSPPNPTPFASTPKPKVSYVPPTPPPFSEPVLALPRSGAVKRYDGRTGVAPLQIQSSVGDHYFVKLEDANSRRPVLAVFVRGGQTEEIEVPLGTYTVKYASGEKWYGETHLFGPATDYSKADQTFTFSSNGYQYSGYTITLYKVRDGNLRTSKIQPTDF